MKRVKVMKSNFYDVINMIYWSEDLIRWAVKEIGKDCYKFDETDKCVYYYE